MSNDDEIKIEDGSSMSDLDVDLDVDDYEKIGHDELVEKISEDTEDDKDNDSLEDVEDNIEDDDSLTYSDDENELDDDVVFHGGGAQDNTRTLRSIYNKSVLTKPIIVSIRYLDTNVQNVAERIIKHKYEGYCIEEGFVKKQSIRNVQCSAGLIVKGHMVKFMVTFECDICHPVENMIVQGIVKKISKAGIQVELENIDDPYAPSPLNIVVVKEYDYNSTLFNNAKINDSVYIRIIGIRYELNDSFISALGQIIKR